MGKSRTDTNPICMRGLGAAVIACALCGSCQASAQQVPPQPSPWSWRAWMYAGGGAPAVEPDERNRGMGASINRAVGEAAVLGFSFGASGADSRTRAAMFSLTLPLGRMREPAPDPDLGWRSFGAATAATPFDPLTRPLTDPPVGAAATGGLQYRDPGSPNIGIEPLAPPPL